MNSGIRPYESRSSGMTSVRSSAASVEFFERMSAPKPTAFLPIRLAMILSRSAKAPPQMERMFVGGAGEAPAADEEDVRGVDREELLVRVLAPALGRHRGDGPLENLQQGLLHSLARDVTRDRRVVRFPCDLVDLVDVDDPGLGLLDVEVRRLDQ